jgi:hypothetical protein
MLGSILQKKSSGVKPHYFDFRLLVHNGDADATEKLVSSNIMCYT